MYGSTVLCPCDANQAAWLTAAMEDIPGVSYLRTCRGDTPVIYQPAVAASAAAELLNGHDG